MNLKKLKQLNNILMKKLIKYKRNIEKMLINYRIIKDKKLSMWNN